ncbi:two-component system sensor histidine kinase NtrB [Virgifigura deserti]|uniref:two-component system sensor histidine kinase NtrB n=1 Tax=Virgifigura deserti TaxID=2268457 RepID=UPI003CCBB596
MTVESAAILNALPEPVFVIDEAGCFRAVNHAAEQFFDSGAAALVGRRIRDLVPADSPLIALIDQVRATGSSMSEYGITLETPRIGSHVISAGAAPIAEAPDCVVVSVQQLTIAHKIDQQLTHRGAARSVTAMAAMLAHEVKNPLSGIRGAAQLLERNASADDLQLTRLICEEADRIVGLVDRMEMFSDQRPIERSAVNIHQILEHVRRVAESGFARGRRIMESYDPSLPPVYGNRDLLIQVFLNLVKNAAEATAETDGAIILTTRYQDGVRLAAPGSQARVHLPLLISVQDNGGGVPEDLRPHLFDPFVTSKIGGKGLGLALVAKIVGDHGGVVEFNGEPRRTVFSVRLPMAPVSRELE